MLGSPRLFRNVRSLSGMDGQQIFECSDEKKEFKGFGHLRMKIPHPIRDCRIKEWLEFWLYYFKQDEEGREQLRRMI